jgi:hypothetical protein
MWVLAKLLDDLRASKEESLATLTGELRVCSLPRQLPSCLQQLQQCA